MKKIGWIIFAFSAIVVGVYPYLYFLTDMNKQGFLSGKSPAVLQSEAWFFFFYQHIIFGGAALLTGWLQFSKKIRNKYLRFHRTLGKIYVITSLLSGIAGLYIAFFATGGVIASLGFGGLAVSWLFTTSKAYLSILRKKIEEHEDWMTRSYALTFAAVMLRIWLILSQVFHIDFLTAYTIISWLCWIPNLLMAEWIVTKRRINSLKATSNLKIRKS